MTSETSEKGLRRKHPTKSRSVPCLILFTQIVLAGTPQPPNATGIHGPRPLPFFCPRRSMSLSVVRAPGELCGHFGEATCLWPHERPQ